MVLGYVFIAGFLLFEAVLRRGESAKSLDRGGSDRGSTVAVGVSYGTAVLLPLVLNLVHVGRMQTPVLSWLGLAAMVSGLALRAWSMRALGTFYSRTLRIVGSQEIIDRGPYRLIRHPGYLGSILLWVGSGLAFSNWTSLHCRRRPDVGSLHLQDQRGGGNARRRVRRALYPVQEAHLEASPPSLLSRTAQR